MIRKAARHLSKHVLILNNALWIRSPEETKQTERFLALQFSSSPSRKHVPIFAGSMFVRVWPPVFRRRGRSKPTAVLISPVGRLGNLVLQLLNAPVIAHHLGVSDVWFKPTRKWRKQWVVGRRFPRGPSGNLSSTTQLQPTTSFGFSSSLPSRLWQTLAMERNRRFYPPGLNSEINSHVRSTLKTFVALSLPTLSEQDLVIHLRSGDIWHGLDPSYGQPPWAFYERVLSTADWHKVWIVSEDQRSPVFSEIVRWCRRNGRSYVHSGQTLTEAVKLLGAAKNLVASVGTFVPGILFIYPAKRRVFFFDLKKPNLLDSNGEILLSVEDLGRSYRESVMSGNWSASVAQISLMKSYPLSSVGHPRQITGILEAWYTEDPVPELK